MSTRNILPGARRPFSRTSSGGIDREHAELARHDDEAALRHDVLRGTEAVAIERGADDVAVGEDERGRAVPRLDEATRGTRRTRASCSGMSACVAHASGTSIIMTCGSERPPATRKSTTLSSDAESEPSGRMIGLKSSRCSSKSFAREERLARAHPVLVAAERVDLAVVRDAAVRVRALPGRERVRREARVDEREAGSGSRRPGGHGRSP